MEKNAYFEMYTVEDDHWWYIGLHNLVVLLINRLYPQQKLRILDAGCGTGGLAAILSNQGHIVEGLDHSDEAIAFCNKRRLKGIIKADINEWTPEPGSYDLIVSMDVLCHKWVLDEIKVLKYFADGLNKQGMVMLNYPAFPILSRHHDKVVMIRERYTIDTLTKIMNAAGLVPLITSYRLPHAFIFLLLRKFFGGKKEDKSDIAKVPPKIINDILVGINLLENRMIAKGILFPIGSSLFVVARKIIDQNPQN